MSPNELIGDDAIFVLDKQQTRAVDLMPDTGKDRKNLALRVLQV